MIPPGRHGEHLAQLVRCRREREAAQDAVERVRALHSRLIRTLTGGQRLVCAECRQFDPCPTAVAVGLGEPQTTDEEDHAHPIDQA